MTSTLIDNFQVKDAPDHFLSDDYSSIEAISERRETMVNDISFNGSMNQSKVLITSTLSIKDRIHKAIAIRDS